MSVLRIRYDLGFIYECLAALGVGLGSHVMALISAGLSPDLLPHSTGTILRTRVKVERKCPCSLLPASGRGFVLGASQVLWSLQGAENANDRRFHGSYSGRAQSGCG